MQKMLQLPLPTSHFHLVCFHYGHYSFYPVLLPPMDSHLQYFPSSSEFPSNCRAHFLLPSEFQPSVPDPHTRCPPPGFQSRSCFRSYFQPAFHLPLLQVLPALPGCCFLSDKQSADFRSTTGRYLHHKKRYLPTADKPYPHWHIFSLCLALSHPDYPATVLHSDSCSVFGFGHLHLPALFPVFVSILPVVFLSIPVFASSVIQLQWQAGYLKTAQSQ